MARKKTASPPPAEASDDRVDELFGGITPEESPAAPPGPPPLFESAADQEGGDFPPLPNLKRGFEEIVESVFDAGVDVVAEYDAIEEALTIGNALTPGAIAEAANQTEKMAARAFRLYIVAKSEYEAYIRETDSIVGAVREAATAKLEKEKAAKIRTKQITDADVVGTAAQMYPDEWQRVNSRRDRAKGMLEYLNNLAALAKSRCFTVSNMLSPGGKL